MKARTVVGRGEEGPLCDPGSEVLLEGRGRVVRGWKMARRKKKWMSHIIETSRKSCTATGTTLAGAESLVSVPRVHLLVYA